MNGIRLRLLAGLILSATLGAGCVLVPIPIPQPRPLVGVVVCGSDLCIGSAPWSMYGATIYNPGLTPYRSGINDPQGTISLASQAKLNTIRLTNFLDVNGDPNVAPFDETRWQRVDAMIAAARDAGMKIDLVLSDYRKMLWNNCKNPYSANWSAYVSFVANRVNTVSGLVYKNDPTIAFVSIAGEPRQTGTYTFIASATGASCTLSYSTSTLTNFYSRTSSQWKQQNGSVLVDSGGLSYIDLSGSGIDWHTIFSLPTIDFCAIKTYGGMLDWAPTAVSYCRSINKPIIDEEFGYTQDMGDAARAQTFAHQFTTLRADQFAGVAFWNLGWEVAPTSYEVSPDTPLTWATVVSNAP